MTITPAAANIIRDWLQRAELAHPVVCLSQVSRSPPEIEQAIKRKANRKELHEIALRALPKEPKYLYPCVYPRWHFLWIFTTTIDGFRFAAPFVHPPAARQAMRRGVLDVAERGLVLKDVDGTVVLPTQASSAL
jgi:hypothetical protein